MNERALPFDFFLFFQRISFSDWCALSVGPQPCDAGKFSNGSAKVCSPCSVGTWSPSGQGRCFSCERGKYAAQESSPTCLACDAGKFADLAGSISCTPCSPGRYQRRSGEGSCDLCSAGTFAANESSFGCQQCPQGMDSSGGSGSCNRASKGYFLDPGEDFEATECPENAECAGGMEIPRPHLGFWVDLSNPEYAGKIYRCERATCTGAHADADEQTVHDDDSSRARHARHLTASPQRGNEGDEENNGTTGCWSIHGIGDDSECDLDAMLCTYGSTGPLWYVHLH